MPKTVHYDKNPLSVTGRTRYIKGIVWRKLDMLSLVLLDSKQIFYIFLLKQFLNNHVFHVEFSIIRGSAVSQSGKLFGLS
jgi:hypothetical protein